jgi:hypothetical protein
VGGRFNTNASRFGFTSNLPPVSTVWDIKIPTFSVCYFICSLSIMKKVTMVELQHNDGFSITLCFWDQLMTYMSNDFYETIITICVITFSAIYICQEEFWTTCCKEMNSKQELLNAVVISVIVGFYDGFIGPGTEFFVVAFIALMGLIFYTLRLECQNGKLSY